MFDVNSPEWQEQMRELEEKKAERSRRDLETNKKRRLSVTLTDDQLSRIQEFAEEHNVSVDDVLSNYIADLTKIHSNGSDERERAMEYFQRTHLAWMYKDDPKWRAKMERKEF